jgi:hypothetical protein
VKPLDSSASFAKTASTLLAVAVLLALPSRADLVLKDSSYGPGTIIEDTVTHLDWLKLTVTQNRSFNDVSSRFGAGQEFAGFQYGDVVQVGQLFKDGGLPSIVPSNTFPWGNIFSNNPSDVAAVTNMINLFGSTFSDADHPVDSAGIIANHDLLGGVTTEVDFAALAIQDTFTCAVMHCAAAHPLNGAEADALGGGTDVLSTAFPQAGSFIFESAPAAVPEPSFTVLIGIGLMAMVLRRILC